MFRELVLLHVDADLAAVLDNRSRTLNALIKEACNAYPEDINMRLVATVDPNLIPERMIEEWIIEGGKVNSIFGLVREIRRAAKKVATWINMNC